MSNTVFYKIAEHIIKVSSPFTFSLREGTSIPFLTEDQSEDFLYEFQEVDELPSPKQLTLVSCGSWVHYYSGNNKLYAFFIYKDVYMGVTIFEQKRASFLYLSESALRELYAQGSAHITYMDIATLLARWDCRILHSSHIAKDGGSILFSAPSGTGKSTQAALWEKYGGYTVVNGDRTGIMKQNGVWNTYGLPVCGTSEICLNQTSNLKAIIVIRQSLDISVEELAPMNAFKAIYSEMTNPALSAEDTNALMDFVFNLVSDVPILQLNCTQYKESYDYLHQYLIERHIISE